MDKCDFTLEISAIQRPGTVHPIHSLRDRNTLMSSLERPAQDVFMGRMKPKSGFFDLDTIILLARAKYIYDFTFLRR